MVLDTILNICAKWEEGRKEGDGRERKGQGGKKGKEGTKGGHGSGTFI